MGTTWNSNSENKNQLTSGRLAPPRKEVARVGKDAASAWTRADKIGAAACFALLGVLLAVSACSKEESKPASVSVSLPSPNPAAAMQGSPAELPGTGTLASSQMAAPAAAKKTRRKLAANVKYSDANSGVSFVYPRKAKLNSGDKADAGTGDIAALPMNFVQDGGAAVATVALPKKQYEGTDFSAALFRVNVNRSVSADQCPHFAFVDTSDADGEPIDAESVKIGSTEMKMTSEFEGNATRQIETRYYHDYENGACYEYVLGLSTSGFGQEGVKAVDRDHVFGKLEKILASVKVRAMAQEQLAQKADETKQAGSIKSKIDADAKKQGAEKVEKSEPEKQSAAVAAVPDPGK
jgi:hypothetical protein